MNDFDVAVYIYSSFHTKKINFNESEPLNASKSIENT